MTPSDRKYTQEHEWVLEENGEVIVGITGHAAEELGDIVYLELPEVGETVSAGDAMGTIETVKAVEDLYVPVSGEIIAVNQDLIDTPEKVNESPYEDGWLIRVRPSGDTVELLTAEDYDQMVAGS